jgi:hypothetical protein
LSLACFITAAALEVQYCRINTTLSDN